MIKQDADKKECDYGFERKNWEESPWKTYIENANMRYRKLGQEDYTRNR